MAEENRKRIAYVARHYDSQEEAEWYLRATPPSTIRQRVQDRELAIVTSCLDIRNFPGRKPRVLDIGCSSGRYTRAMMKKGFAVVGIDTAAIPLANALKLTPGADFIRASALDLPFAGEIFDVVICIELLHHFGDEALQGALTQIGRVLKPGGLFIFDLKNRMNPIMWYIYHRQDSIEFTLKTRTISQMARLAQGCGFTLIKKSPILFPIASIAPFLIFSAVKSTQK